MNTNPNKLALRRDSIRVLTDELRIAHGGDGGNGTGGDNGTGHTTKHTTGTHRPSLTSTDLPPQTITIA
jgi:hypothetical protein